jgi:hypothetical protein
MKTKTELVASYIKENNIEKALKVAGAFNWSKTDLSGQQIKRSKDILNNKRFYEELFKLKGLCIEDVLKEGINALLNHKQFKLG